MCRQVGQGHLCLWCGERGKRFSSREDVQRHMVDKGHCKMRHEAESLLEYDEWYDYSASYPEGSISTQATHCRLSYCIAVFAGDPAGEDGEDGEVDLNTLDDSGFELQLPSGTRVGHRSLIR